MDLKQLTKRAAEIRNKYANIEQKNKGKSWSNLNLMEGFVGDVGDLMKIIMAKEGVRDMEDIDQKLKHELADCLWSVLVLADKYNIDLEQSFLQTMNELEQKIKTKEKELNQ